MRQKSDHPRIRIRKLDQYPDFEKLVDIQRAVWKHDETDITPTHQFRVSSKMGGILLGAYVGKELAGFVFSFPAVFEKKLCQHSHHLAVLPAYQGLGIGKRMKWAQRDWSLRLGYSLITWTQDPLQSRNANLNFHTLGAMSKTYFSNFYGTTPSLTPAPNLPTDRLLLEWPIGSPRVEMRRRGKSDEYNIAGLAIALEKTPGSGDLPATPRLSLKERFILAEVPARIRTLEKSPALISAWQAALRKVLSRYFRRGYAVVDLLFGERCFYILEKQVRA